VRQVFARLTPKHQRCLALREYQGLSYAEIARELRTTPNTVKTLLYRAREAFRRHYRQLYPTNALA
jgi:RNA polymerase sigma-70 factor (ECF subfamily)